MGKIGTISPLKKTYSTEFGQSLASSLSQNGMTRYPGTFSFLQPYKERNGEYRTGLDPNALYIKALPKEEREQEIARVTALKEELEGITGLDLSPKSDFYTKMYQPDTFGSQYRASYVKLIDGPNTFNLSDPMSAITYAWLRVHPDIAPSYFAYERGKSNARCPQISQCQFFVDDEEYETEIAYKDNIIINKAINGLDNMSPTRQLKIAKLLNLPISYNSKPAVIYNAINKYIKEGTAKHGARLANVKTFNEIASMADENIDIRFNIKEAIDFNIYRRAKNGKLMEGDVLVGDSEDDVVEYFSNPKNQDDYLALKKKIQAAQVIDIS